MKGMWNGPGMLGGCVLGRDGELVPLLGLRTGEGCGSGLVSLSCSIR